MKASWATLSAAALLYVTCSTAATAQEISPEDRDLFESRIRPLLAEKCYGCHSAAAKSVKAGLLLDSKAGWMRGGETGTVVVPGSPEESLLWIAVSYENPDLQMPPKKKLAPDELAALREWIERGAPDPRSGEAPPRKPDPAGDFDLEARRDSHWAWRPVRVEPPPRVEDSAWPRDEIDRYVLARLEAAGLAPAPPAPPATWLRRVTFDLTGLPPARDEVEAFLRDASPRAFEYVVERLLDSPRFGEHWAQHWLDLVRYAETKGHEGDFSIPHAYRYRDYAIRAFNADVPYDRFVIEHVAGDLVDPPRLDPVERTNESVQGTGFWHLGEATHSPVDIRGEEADRVANQIDVFSKTFLGLSLGCARCHDHKFDAISTEDYYALAGYLQSSSYHLMDVSDPEAQNRAVSELRALADRYVPRVTRAFSEAVESRVARLDDYLLAARDVLRRAPGEGEAEALVAAVAGERQLSPEVLHRWVEALKRAAGNAGDLLHPFAALALEPGEPGPEIVSRRQAEILETWRGLADEGGKRLREQKVVTTVEEGERNYVKSERPVAGSDLVVDFARPGADDWITVGHRFGGGPAAPGRIVLGASGERPIRRVVERAEANADLLSGKLSGMLRTRTFEVTSDTLWSRFRGKADVFLAVDSHRTVLGPLHGVVQQKLEGGDGYEWKSHNVRDYIGHRVHVEFTPTGDFALREIRFAAAEPVEAFRPNGEVVRLLESPVISVPAMAGLYRDLVVGSVASLAGFQDVTGDPGKALDTAAIVNWLVARDDLLDRPGEGPTRIVGLVEEYAAERAAIEARIPAPVEALALIDGSGEDEYVHIRGNHKTLAARPVGRRFLTALAGDDAPPPARGSGRLDLARQMTDPENPLLSRVLVNRLWHHLFGRGIVPTADDFGVMGERPTHPLLLDYLAAEFVAGGWSIKGLLRRMVLSSTYRMSSRPDGKAAEIDPANSLLHRMRIRRLTGEAIRDSILAISGRLDPKMYGPSVMVHITPFMRGNRSPGDSGPVDGDGRRSIYVEVRRNHLSHFLTTFDRPSPFATIGGRSASNSPAQPLILLNDPLVHQEARRWAEKLLERDVPRPGECVTEAYYAAFGRPPEDWEAEEALEFLKAALEGDAAGDPAQAWTDLCHTLMNVKEFIFIN